MGQREMGRNMRRVLEVRSEGVTYGTEGNGEEYAQSAGGEE